VWIYEVNFSAKNSGNKKIRTVFSRILPGKVQAFIFWREKVTHSMLAKRVR
jgi:hypothetical protein